MELDELFSNIHASLGGFISQCLEVAGGEVMVRVLWAREGLLELIQPPSVALKVLLVLRVDSFQLAIQGGREEKGGDEELSEAI